MPGILYTNYYLPDTYVKAEEIYLQKYDRITAGIMLESSKLDKITVILDKNEILYKFIELLDDLFFKTKIDPAAVKYIIYTDKATYVTSSCLCIPYYLQEKYKMDRASAFLAYQNCCSVFQTLDILNSMYNNEADYYTIVLSATYKKGDIKDRETLGVIVGDGLGVMLIGPDRKRGCRIIDTVTKSCGCLSYQEDIAHPYNKLNMEMRIKTITGIIRFINEFIGRNGLEAKDIKKFIPQSMDVSINKTLADLLQVPFEKVFSENIPKCGHLGATDLIQNMHDVLHSGELERGDYFLCCGAGVDQSIISTGCILCRVE